MAPISELNVQIVALGSPDRGDDGAALLIAERFTGKVPVVLAGRPGAALLDLLQDDRFCVLLDVTVTGARPGTVHSIPLASLRPGVLPDARVSSHGFGPAEAMALARALGRPLTRGHFVGIEGESFEFGASLSHDVRSGLDRFEDAVREQLERERPLEG
jgi:hydrogenase maturation protease